MKTSKRVKCSVCGTSTKRRDYTITGNDGVARSVYLCVKGPHSTLIKECS